MISTLTMLLLAVCQLGICVYLTIVIVTEGMTEIVPGAIFTFLSGSFLAYRARTSWRDRFLR